MSLFISELLSSPPFQIKSFLVDLTELQAMADEEWDFEVWIELHGFDGELAASEQSNPCDFPGPPIMDEFEELIAPPPVIPQVQALVPASADAERSTSTPESSQPPAVTLTPRVRA